MKKFFFKIYFVLLVFHCGTGFSQASEKYNFGIFPYYDSATLIKLHKPLKDWLEKETGEQISMRSAANFKSFASRTADGDYDILLTAPHLGRTADVKNGYKWIGFTQNRSHAVFVVRNDSNYKSLEDLKGKSITLPPRAAIIHHMALKKMKDSGLEPGRDIEVKVTSSHNNAMMSVVNGTSPVAAFGKPTWNRYLKRETIPELKEITHSEEIPGFALMVNSRISDSMTEKIKQAVFKFANTDEGRNYFEKSSLKGFREATDEDFKQLDAYLAEIQKSKK